MASDQGLPDNRFTVNLAEFCQLLVDTGLLRADISNTHVAAQSSDHELSLTVRAPPSLPHGTWSVGATTHVRPSPALPALGFGSQAAREIFAGVQRDEAGPFAKATVENPMQELVLSEFLEAIARCGYVKFDSEDLSVAQRIKRAIDAIVAIAPPELRAKPKKQGACSRPSRTAAAADVLVGLCVDLRCSAGLVRWRWCRGRSRCWRWSKRDRGQVVHYGRRGTA